MAINFTDLRFDLPRDPLEDSPDTRDWLISSGYKLASDGTYKRVTNIGGAQQIESLSPDQIQRDYLSRQYLQQASALPQGSPDYLSAAQARLRRCGKFRRRAFELIHIGSLPVQVSAFEIE